MNSTNAFKNWYKNYFGYGSKQPVYFKGAIDENHLGTSIVNTYYRNYLIPMAYLASGIAQKYISITKNTFRDIYKNTELYGIPVGDDSDWKVLFDYFYKEHLVEINDIIHYLDNLNISNAWLYILEDFLMYYDPNTDLDIKTNINNAWKRFLKDYEVRVAWPGPGYNDILLVYKKGTSQPAGVYGNVVFKYPASHNKMLGNSVIEEILVYNSMDAYSDVSVQLIRDFVQQNPMYASKIPSDDVPIIENGKIVNKKLSVIELGVGVNPPVEVVKALKAYVSDSMVQQYGNIYSALNHVINTSVKAHQDVYTYFNKPEVSSMLQHNVHLEHSNDVNVYKLPTPTVENIEEPQINPLEEKYNSLKEGYRLVLEEMKEQSATIEKLEKELNSKRDIEMKLSDSEAELKRLLRALDDKDAELEQYKSNAPTAPVEDKYSVLKENDPYYAALDYVCKEMRLRIYNNPTIDNMYQFKPVHEFILKLALKFFREDPSGMIEFAKRCRAGSEGQAVEVLNGAITLLEKHSRH